MNVKIKINKYLFLYSIIIAWSLWMQYIISFNIKSLDITNILVIIFMLAYFVEHSSKINLKCAGEIIVFVILAAISSIAASLYFGQSFFQGFLVMRHMYLQYAIFIPLYNLSSNGKLESSDVYKTTIGHIRFACLLYVLHYLLYQTIGVSLLNISASTFSRYGSARFYFVLIMPAFLLFNAISNIYKSDYRFLNFFDAIMVLFLMAQVGKMRMSTLAAVAAILIGLMISKRLGTKKVVFLIAFMGVGYIFLMYTAMGKDLMDVVFKDGSAGSSSVREIGRLRHINSVIKHPLFGLGYPHEDCLASMMEFGTADRLVIDGTVQRIYIGDNGIFDYLYIFGASGIVWMIYMFFGMFKKSYRIQKTMHNSAYFMFFLFTILSLYTELNWFFFGMLFWGIIKYFVQMDYQCYCKNEM